MFRSLVWALLLIGSTTPLSAAPVVIVNATDRTVDITLEHEGVPAKAVKLAIGEARAIQVGREPILKFTQDGKTIPFRLDPYQIYAFGVDRQGKLGFQGVELIAEMPKTDDVPLKPTETKTPAPTPFAKRLTPPA